MDNAYYVLSDKIRNGEIPFDEAEECAKLWGALSVALIADSINTNTIQGYMEDL